MRLDQLLVLRGLCDSRERAQRAIMAGEVSIDGRVLDKAGQKLPDDSQIVLRTPEKYVGRGGLKLEGALQAFGVDPTGRTCLDIGASTGGFTDCLLQNGAEHVWAIDVGHDQLAWKIRSHPRVTVREHMNARHMRPEDFPCPFGLCVMDVSFISLTLILPAAVPCLAPGAELIPLIKPQFELKPEQVGKGGIVRDPAAHEEAVEKIRTHTTKTLGLEWCGLIESPILGGEGNKEFLAHLRLR